MTTPNMATITAFLERSLQNCSLNHQQSSSSTTGGGGGGEAAHGSDSPPNLSTTPTLELNSQASLPFHWEQCLDLKTGEIYYINWKTGMKAKEDPRTRAEYGCDYYSDDDSTSYDSDGSCSESYPSSSSSRREQSSGNNNNNQENSCYYYQQKNEIDENNSNNNNNNVLVVAGCKSCLMYYMVPKQLDICPKCSGQLLHF